jgi:hypothetical protein
MCAVNEVTVPDCKVGQGSFWRRSALIEVTVGDGRISVGA